MDYKFLHKVLDQIVRETMVNGVEERVYPPNSNDTNSYSFSSPPLFTISPFVLSLPLSLPSFLPTFFYLHCRDVYGLNNEESKYVWKEYVQIIKDKIKNNG